MNLNSEERFACCIAADDEEWHRTELAELWRTIGEQAAWVIADEHELASVGAPILEKRAGLSLPERWTRAASAVRERISLHMQAVDRIAEALHAAGILVVALKNAGIARGIFEDLAGCPMGDIDLLVQPSDLAPAHKVLISLGLRLLGNQDVGREGLAVRISGGGRVEEPDSDERDQLAGGREYALDLVNGEPLWVELQCRTIGGKWIASEAEPKAADFIARSVAIPGTAARLLAPEDNLLQVCLHTAKHSYVRAPGFRLHTDVDRIVRRCPIDWERFVAEVERLQVKTAVYFSLFLPAELLRTPVPAAVLKRLRPSGWKQRAILRSLRRAGLFHPHQRKWSKAGYILFNLFLYDSLSGVVRAIIPPADTMKQRYGFTSSWVLPWFHLRRCVELLLKRAKT